MLPNAKILNVTEKTLKSWQILRASISSICYLACCGDSYHHHGTHPWDVDPV